MSDLRARVKPKRTLLKVTLGAVLTLGLALVILDIVGVGGASYLVATEQIIPGDSLTQRNTRLVRAELGEASANYLTAIPTGEPSKEGVGAQSNRSFGAVATRSFSAGELIPSTAVATTEGSDLAAIAIDFGTPLARTIVAGSRVDIFSTRLLSGAQVDEPRMIAAGAWVRKIETDTSVGRTTHVVDLALSRMFLPEVLAAVARSDFLTLVESAPSG